MEALNNEMSIGEGDHKWIGPPELLRRGETLQTLDEGRGRKEKGKSLKNVGKNSWIGSLGCV